MNLLLNKTDKIIVLFYIGLAISYGAFIFASSLDVTPSLVAQITPKKITDFETSAITDVKREKIFSVMTDVENFANVLPENIRHVKILNKTENTIIASEELTDTGIRIRGTVKHTMTPYSEHVIKIIDGDAKGTVITQVFEDVGNQTNIITKVHLNVTGTALKVAYMPQNNLTRILDTMVSSFVDYSKLDPFESKVDTMYKKILHREADKDGLLYYSELLRNGQMTEDQIRTILLNSEEISSVKMKSVTDLSDETKAIIDDLYEKILLRKADPEGLKYYGNLLEQGTSLDDIRTMLLQSEEGRHASFNNPVRSQIKTIIFQLLHRPANSTEVNYYHKMVDDGLMTFEDIKNEIKKFPEYKP